MDSIRKKAGYLQGIIDSMGQKKADPEFRLKSGIVELLGELADRIEVMDELIGELNDYVESIDDDLTELEGIHDEDDDDIFDMHAFPAEEPFRVIENEGGAAPERMLTPARCPECAAVFLTDGSSGRFRCPVCEKSVKPQRLTRKNTPVAQKSED